MKKLMLVAAVAFFFAACNNEKKEEKKETAGSSIQLPYKASYSSQFDRNVSDSDLLGALNSYKYWENGDMKGLASTLADTVAIVMTDGTQMAGPKSGIIDFWTKHRDSISKVEITMDAWTKEHSIDSNTNFVLAWYKEIDTYKTGKVDSANYADVNQMKNGKITWYSTYRQELKKK